MKLVEFLTMASDPEMTALIVRWGGYALILFLIVVVLLVALNTTGQAKVNHRRF